MRNRPLHEAGAHVRIHRRSYEVDRRPPRVPDPVEFWSCVVGGLLLIAWLLLLCAVVREVLA